MRYERAVEFEEREIIIETEEERVAFNKLISMACAYYASHTGTDSYAMYQFVTGIRSGKT